MSRGIEVHCNCLGRIIFADRRFVVVESCAESSGCLSRVLNATTDAGNDIDYIFRITSDMLFDGKDSRGGITFDGRA